MLYEWFIFFMPKKEIHHATSKCSNFSKYAAISK